MSIKIELTLDEVNTALMALGNMPYAQVQPLIEKVRDQVIPQVQQGASEIAIEPEVAE